MKGPWTVRLMVIAIVFRLSRGFGISSSGSAIARSTRRAYSQAPVLLARKRREHHYKIDMGGEDNWDSWEFGQYQTLTEGEEKAAEELQKAAAANEEEESAARQVSTADIHKATQVLSQFATPQRLQRLNSILARRTRHVRVVFENPANPNNIWACLRTLDSFGVQYADIVCDPAHYRKSHRLFNMQAAVGAQRWLSLTEYRTAKECVESLRAQGYRIAASDLAPGTTPQMVQAVDWAGGRIAVVMGNEERGITQEMRELCDFTYQIPMLGFAESFNLSVSCAVTLAYISAAGGLKHGDLSLEERDKLMLRWVMKSVRGAVPILRREKLIHSAEAVAPKETIMGYTVE